MRFDIRTIALATLVATAVLAPHRGWAQVEASDESRRSFATRADLAAEADRAQREGRALEAAKLRHRLTEGDFREGDRILFTLQGATGIGDTLVVRAGRILQFPSMEDFSVAGVLRSELAPKLTAHLARFIREPQIRVVPLLRLAVVGAVRGPGFYYVPADIPLSDILMRAGGPAPEADLGKVEVKRESEVLLDRKASRMALADGLSADKLHLETGDQIAVGERRRFSWQAIASTAVASSGLIIAIVRGTRGEKKVEEPTCP